MASVVDRAIFRTERPGRRSRLRIGRYGLTVAASTTPPARACVVFVHGLNGHVVDTWRQFPRLLTADRALDDLDLGFFGYETTVFDGWAILRRLGRWLPVARAYDFEAKARELGHELVWLHRTRELQRLVVAAHSLGGLITLEALRQLVESGEPERLETARRVSALVFYGTPFLGSDRVTRLTALASPDLRALVRRRPLRDELGNWVSARLFGHLLRLDDTYTRVGVLYSPQDTWVDLESALGRFPEGLAEQWAAPHTALCKPADTDSRPYVLLMGLLVSHAAPFKPLAPVGAPAYRLFSTDVTELEETRALYEDRLPPEERVDWPIILDALRHSEAQEAGRAERPTHLRYLFATKGVDGHVTGFLYAHYRLGGANAWLAYLVAERGKERNLAARLGAQLAVHLRQQGQHCKAIIFEVEQPETAMLGHDARAGARRRARIRLYASLGPVYAVTGLAYRQPRLSPDGDKEVPMHLLFVPVPATRELKWLTRDEVRSMLRWIADVQCDAFAGHRDLAPYSDYLDRWIEELSADLGPSVQVAPARTLLRPR